jgi:hypothetical protein
MSLSTSLRKALTQRGFIVTAIVLGLAAVGLNGATSYMKLSFQKLPVELRRPVETIPATLGPWRQVMRDERLMPEIEEALGTQKYIMRFYYDTRRITPAQFEDAQRRADAGQGHIIELVRRLDPSAVINFAVTYYTGMVDTVAHVPDRCYTASGYEPESKETIRWKLFPDRPAELADVSMCFTAFADPSSSGSVPTNVGYLFHTNGEYRSDPIEVRVKLQNLREKYGYYAKVELMTVTPNKQQAAETMRDFLFYALPEVEKVLPDWEAVTSGTAGGLAQGR